MDYVLRGTLGHGTFGAVYAASPVDGDGEEVAVKIIDVRKCAGKGLAFDDDTAAVDPMRAITVRKEIARMMTVGPHENVCRLLGRYVQGGLAYIVLEKLDMSLFDALQMTPVLNEDALRRFVNEMLMGLSFVHSRGVIHRDVKPENLLCHGSRLTVKLCDFGVACTVPRVVAQSDESIRRASENSSVECYTATTPSLSTQATKEGGVVGTSAFMAPEVVLQKHYSIKVDAWSLGVSVYALCFGRFPYIPSEPTSAAMRKAIGCGHPAPSFNERPDGPSVEMLDWMHKLLLREPGVRPTCEEVRSHPWFDMEGTAKCDLRPALLTARRCGVFGNFRTPAPHSMLDKRVRALQRHRHSQPPMEAKVASMFSEISTEAGHRTASSGPDGE